MNWQNHLMNGLVLGVLTLMAISAAAPADSVYVNGTCGNDGWTGQSEVCAAPDGPKKTIQAGIDAAVDGDEVVLADGVYAGRGNKNIDLLGKSITLRSTSDAHGCVIDCEGDGRAMVIANSGATPQIIQGIGFHNGSGQGGFMQLSSHGGAILSFDSSPTFIACEFLENHGGVGGAVELRYGPKATFRSCGFIRNSADGGGGALAVYDTSAEVIDCAFVECDGGNASGAIEACVESGVRVVNGRFIGCHAGFIAGAVHACDSSIYINCIYGNNASSLGGAVHTNGVPDGFYNCTFIHNAQHAVYLSGGSPQIFKSCIVWSNVPGPFAEATGSLDLTFSDIEGGWPGRGNIDADPLFVQPGVYDLSLSFGSPCTDAGLTAALPADEFDLDGDGDFDEPIPYDAAGNPRVQGAAVDMGAYEGEYRPLPPQASVLDLGPGETAFLVPMGGSFNPVESSVAVVTNGSTTTAEVTLTQYAIAVHPLAGTYSELGSTMAMQTTLAPGTMHNRMFITFTAGELRGRDPLSLDLTSFYAATGNWRLAVVGNSAPSPGYEGPVGDRIAVEGTGLDWGVTTDQGDYGVFWNPVLQKGFVWANLDYAADFAFGTALCYADCAPPNGDGVVDNTDVQGLLAGWGHRAGGIFDISLDGIVNGFDLALLLGAWGTCDGGVAPITAPQKVIAPNWGRVVTATQREVDLDGNGEIDGRDMSLILAAWSGDQPASAESNAADLNGDGRVNRDDVDALLGRR